MPDKPLVALTRRIPAECEARLARDYRVRLGDDAAVFTPARLAEQAAGAAALVVTPAEVVDAAAVAALPAGVKVLSLFSVGHEHVDVAAAAARGIVVTHTPGVLTEATADIAMLLLLGAMRRASEGERLMRSGAWTGWRPTQLLGWQLADKNLGIVGLGRIGAAVAARARAFGMNILYHNRAPKPEATALQATFFASLDDMLARSHVLSLHCPLSPTTQGLVNARTLAKLPTGAVLVNTARGGHMVDDDLITALMSGHVAAAGLDVYAGEPNLDARYLALPNVFLLPHLGSATVETRAAMGHLAIDNLAAVLDGREAKHVVRA